MAETENTKLALITGATGKIGSAISERLVKENYKVGLAYFNKYETACDLAERLNVHQKLAVPVEIDYSKRDSIKEAQRQLQEHFQSNVDILVNNGAIAQEKPFFEISDEDWGRMLDVNLQGPFRAAQVFLPGMLEKQWGRVINISSIGGQWGGFNQVHYAAAKAGLINLTRSLAKLYSNQGVSSTAIAIGLVASPMSENELNTEAGKRKVSTIPAKRLGTAEEVAETVSFLCSESSSYLSGQTINLNGGMYFS